MTFIHNQYFLICYCHSLAARLYVFGFPIEVLSSSIVLRRRRSETPLGDPSFCGNPLYSSPRTGLLSSAPSVIFLWVQLECTYVSVDSWHSMMSSLCHTQQLLFSYFFTLSVPMPSDVTGSYRLLQLRLVFKQILTLKLQFSESHNSECPSLSKVFFELIQLSSLRPNSVFYIFFCQFELPCG